MDINHLDIGHYTGHKAIEELARSRWIYLVPIAEAMAAEGIHVTSFDFKKEHDIEDLSRRMRVVDLDIESVDPINAFHWSGILRSLRKKEGERCINSAIFFQAMMEAEINDHLGGAAEGLSFATKWRNFLDTNAAPTDVRKALEDYVEHIYKKIRIRAVHAKTRVGGLDADSLRFPFVYSHLESGWRCGVFLNSIKHNLQLNHEDNWKTICHIHGIPPFILAADFPDMGALASAMSIKHVEFFNQTLQGTNKAVVDNLLPTSESK